MINEKNAKKYCKEELSKIENYDKAIADTAQVWVLHHRTEIWWNCTAHDLIANECYYNRKACELIFLTRSEHRKLHNKGRHLSEETRRKLSEALKGLRHSEESRKKMSESRKGKNNPMYGKNGAFLGKHHNADTRKKMSESHKGLLKNKTWKIINGKRVWLSKES